MLTTFGAMSVAACLLALAAGAPLEALVVVSVPFQGSSVLNFHGSGLPLFYALASVLAVTRLVTPRRRSGGRPAPHLFLASFVIYSSVITMLGPELFAGLPVLSPHLGIDAQVYHETPLRFSSSNVAELLFLVLGYAAAMNLAAWVRTSPLTAARALRYMVGVELLLVSWQLLSRHSAAHFPTSLFENSPSRSYVMGGVGIGPRLNGTFSEPSLLAAFLLVSVVFTGVLFLQPAIRNEKFFNCLLCAGSLAELPFVSSGTALIGFALIPGLAFVALALRVLRGRRLNEVAVATGATFLAATSIALATTGLLSHLFEDIHHKTLSSSYTVRGLSNQLSWHTFVRTGGVGAGLGSNRPSSLAFMLLSCVGVVGTCLLGAQLLLVVKRLLRRKASGLDKALALGLVTLLLLDIASSPDLSTPMFWGLLGLALGVGGQGAVVYGDPSRRSLTTARSALANEASENFSA